MSRSLHGPTPGQEPPEFLVDRTLGRSFIRQLRESGWRITAVAEVFPNDGQSTSDEEWISYAVEHRLAGITCDKRIRRQPSYLSARHPIFALSSNQLLIEEQVRRMVDRQEKIFRAAVGGREFWMVYEDRIQRVDPM